MFTNKHNQVFSIGFLNCWLILYAVGSPLTVVGERSGDVLVVRNKLRIGEGVLGVAMFVLVGATWMRGDRGCARIGGGGRLVGVRT